MDGGKHFINWRVFVLFIPFMFVLLTLIYIANFELYWSLTNEDGLLEWLTFFSLFFAFLISFFIKIKIKKYKFSFYWFFLFFTIFLLFSAMEEISWGQRILDIKSSGFFIENSTQGETNVHNLFQKWGRSLPFFGYEYNFKTKHLAGLTLFLYGAILPIVALNKRAANFFNQINIVVPPLTLSFSFFLAALMMIDKPTGREEEIGEFLFSVCLLLFIIWEYMKLKEMIVVNNAQVVYGNLEEVRF